MKYKRSRKLKIWILGLVLVAVIIVLILELTGTTHVFHKAPVVRAPSKPITQLPSSNSDNNVQKNPDSHNGIAQGAAVDQSGKTPGGVPTDPSKWSRSESGVIIVKLPGNGDTFKSGSTITGTASVSVVQYRLIDDKVGVIAQGPISVKDGKFTALLSFTPHGSSGRLDVFSTDSGGREINEVQISVKF